MIETRKPRERVPESEKITINLGFVDLGRIDLLVQEGFYSNRTDFIRTAIRNQLGTHGEEVSRSLERKTLELGLRDIGVAELEAARAAGEKLHLKVVGLLRIAPDVRPNWRARRSSRSPCWAPCRPPRTQGRSGRQDQIDRASGNKRKDDERRFRRGDPPRDWHLALGRSGGCDRRSSRPLWPLAGLRRPRMPRPRMPSRMHELRLSQSSAERSSLRQTAGVAGADRAQLRTDGNRSEQAAERKLAGRADRCATPSGPCPQGGRHRRPAGSRRGARRRRRSRSPRALRSATCSTLARRAHAATGFTCRPPPATGFRAWSSCCTAARRTPRTSPRAPA